MNNDQEKNMLTKNVFNKYIFSYTTSTNLFPLTHQTSNHKNIIKNDSLIELDKKNLSNKKDESNKKYLTVRNKDKYNNAFLISKEKKLKKYKSIEDLKNEDLILNKIFPYNNEFNKYSNLPFFYLTKRQNYLSDDEKTNKKLLKEDFIYKISHGDRFITNNDNNNFNKNKSIKKGLTMNYIDIKNIKNESTSTELKLELNIKNLNRKKNYFSNKEKYFSFLKSKLNDLKTGNIFKKLEEDIFNFNEDNDLEHSKKINKNKTEKFIKEYNSKVIKNISNINKSNNNNILENDEKCLAKSLSNTKYNNNNINYFMKKPLKYPINFYSSKQLEIKKKRYEKTHKEGWKEFKRKINIRNVGYNSIKNINNPMALCVLEPNRDLQKKNIMTNKKVYLHECRIRDILISNKLKFEYSKEDIKRILNGQKPWTDFDENNKGIENKKI